jgi:hypothetical protein
VQLAGRKVIGAGAGGDEGARHVARRVERAAYQYERAFPINAHAALRGVHGFCNA